MHRNRFGPNRNADARFSTTAGNAPGGSVGGAGGQGGVGGDSAQISYAADAGGSGGSGGTGGSGDGGAAGGAGGAGGRLFGNSGSDGLHQDRAETPGCLQNSGMPQAVTAASRIARTMRGPVRSPGNLGGCGSSRPATFTTIGSSTLSRDRPPARFCTTPKSAAITTSSAPAAPSTTPLSARSPTGSSVSSTAASTPEPDTTGTRHGPSTHRRCLTINFQGCLG